jgi:error-prone DNA polymerase
MLINDSKRSGIRVLPPDINDSSALCTVGKPGEKMIRIGLSFIKGLSQDEAKAIVAERERNGVFLSLADFIRRVALREETIRNMIAVGVFDCFGLGRREALWQVGLFIPTHRFGRERTAAGRARKPNRVEGLQPGLPLPIEQDLVELPPTKAWDRVAADYRVLGLSPRYHPVGLLRAQLGDRVATSRDIETIEHDAPVWIAGLVVCRQHPQTAKGVTFLLIEDELGLTNIVVYRTKYEEQRMLVRNEPLVVVEGTLKREGRNVNIIAKNLYALKPWLHAQEEQAQHPLDIKQIEVLTALDPVSHNFR